MEQQVLAEQLSEVNEYLDTADVTVIRTTNQPFESFALQDVTLTEAVSLGEDLGVSVFYVLESRDDSGRPLAGGVCFFYRDRPHTVVHQTDAAADTNRDPGRQSPFLEETEAERQRRQELVNEILSKYDEHLSEDERFELENHPDRMRVRRLIRMRDRLEETAKTDPEEEKRLAQLVHRDDRFGRQFNQMDTEMLLEEMEVDYDPELVRIENVHKRAKSLLKVNR